MDITKDVYTHTSIEELKREMGDLKIVQQNALHDLDKTKNERDDLSYDMQAAFRKISTMEAQKKVAEDANFGRAVETIMDAKLKGVHAPLAKLGTVDKEYSLALEVAFLAFVFSGERFLIFVTSPNVFSELDLLFAILFLTALATTSIIAISLAASICL